MQCTVHIGSKPNNHMVWQSFPFKKNSINYYTVLNCRQNTLSVVVVYSQIHCYLQTRKHQVGDWRQFFFSNILRQLSLLHFTLTPKIKKKYIISPKIRPDWLMQTDFAAISVHWFCFRMRLEGFPVNGPFAVIFVFFFGHPHLSERI